MSFWPVAVAIPVVAAALLCMPLFRSGARSLGTAAVVLVLVPAGSLLLYQTVGTPEGIETQSRPHGVANTAGDLNAALEELQTRLRAQPNDIEGWILLGRTYKAVEQHERALAALRQAQSLAPDNPLIKVELAESLIFTSGGGSVSDEIRTLLQSAIDTEPRLQKGLWLLGVVAAQDGNDPLAVTYWQQLLAELDPQGGVAQAVQREVDAARGRMGMTVVAGNTLPPAPAGVAAARPEPAPSVAVTAGTAAAEIHPVEPGTGTPWPGLTATVSAPEDLGVIPPTAALFLIARDPAAPNPPLGAVRLPNPVFPVSLRLTDANSMMAARPISGVPEVEITARLSLSGSPMPNNTDPRSEPAVVETGAPRDLRLQLTVSGR